jgi:hypothetical protein
MIELNFSLEKLNKAMSARWNEGQSRNVERPPYVHADARFGDGALAGQ